MAALHSNIPLPPKLDIQNNLSQTWKNWRQIWDSYEIVAGLQLDPLPAGADAAAIAANDRENYRINRIRLATFITCIGQEALEVYNGLPFNQPEDKNNIDMVLQLFEHHCVGETNVIYERYLFNNRIQEPETIDAYASALRTMAQTCEFGELRDSLIRDRIVCGIKDNALRKRLLQERHLPLNVCIDKCRAAAVADQRMRDMTGKEVSAVHRGKYSRKPGSTTVENRADSGQRDSNVPKCKFCCRNHKFKKELCPAWGQPCKACGINNHFQKSKVCKKNINSIQESYDSDTETSSSESINIVQDVYACDKSNKPIYCKMLVNEKMLNDAS